MIGMQPPITLRTPGVMSTAELAVWAQIGKNAVPQFVSRFGIRELTGNAKNHRYQVNGVIRAILKVTPQTPEELEILLAPLQKVSWVSAVTGLSISAISAGVCEKRGALPFPVELTATRSDQAPARGRRWIPAQIEAHLRGAPIPFIASQAPPPKSSPKYVPGSARNVFAAICNSNAEVSRQLRL